MEELRPARLSGGTRDVGSDDVGRVPVQVAAGPLWRPVLPHGHKIVILSVASVTHSGHMVPGAHLGRTVAISSAVPGRCAV